MMENKGEAKHTMALRRHDVRGAVEGLKTLVMLLKSGYHFDDARAPEFIAEIEGAVLLLEKEILQPRL